jgi:acyl-coenzyme A synthetase/AMP-(fatty) acid ligase
MWLKTGINIFGESLFLANNFQVTARDRIVATISPYHVYGLLYSITLPLVSGASVVGAMPSFPEEISCTVAESRATILISVPAHYRVLRGKPALGDSVRLAFSSAGPLDPEDNRAFCETNRIGIVEVYGSTETGGVALRNRFVGEDHLTPYPTVGWQIQNEQLRVSSPYLSPNLEKDATGFFTTGDRVEEAGKVGFVLKGRSDSITKVAGNRVDLEEISAFIKSQSGVTDCLVWAIAESGGRQQRIVALIEAEVVDLDGLRRLLGGRFEPYAIPRMIKAVTRMPLKENGKYDRDEIMRLFA